MKRMTTLVFLGLLTVPFAPGSATAQTLLFDFVGFDYESPNPNPAAFGEPGSGYFGVGFVPGLFLPLVADTASNEYTYLFSNLTPVSQSTIGSYVVINYSAGTLSIYEDAKAGGTPAAFVANPPNPDVPSDFTDGTLFLTGTLSGFQIVMNTANGSGSFEGAYQITGGSQFAIIPPDQQTGWTFAGATSNALNIPPGYEHQVDGQTFVNEPTPVRQSSWGGLKVRYR